jgi:glycosyltransferase involved in cell wall biosynthesis
MRSSPRAMRPKRVSLFLPSLIPGGAERSALFVARTLEAAGYAVELVAAHGKGGLERDPFVAAHLVDLGARDALTGMFRYRRWLRAARPDLVISFVHSANLVSALMADATPLIVSIRNSLEKDRRDQWWVRRTFGFAPERRLYRRAARLHVISQELAEQARRLLGATDAQLVVTRNTAALPAPGDTDPAEAVATAPYILSVGRLAPIKGFDVLIRAAARAGQRLVILGDGPERARLEALVRETGAEVLLPGFRDPAPWLAHAQGFAFASRGEGVPRAIMEALAAALPIVATRCPGGTVELLDDGRFGRLVAMDDVDALAQGMRDMAAGTLLPAPAADRDAHLALYGAEAVGAAYVAMVREVIGAP